MAKVGPMTVSIMSEILFRLLNLYMQFIQLLVNFIIDLVGITPLNHHLHARLSSSHSLATTTATCTTELPPLASWRHVTFPPRFLTQICRY